MLATPRAKAIRSTSRPCLCTPSAKRNKRSVTVDIATPEGQRIIRELAAQSDVVMENYKVGQLQKYGLDYASLKEIKPDLIYCSVTGFGQTGPYAQRAGYDFIVQGIGESRYGADAGASASLSLSNTARLYINYDGKFRTALQSHQGTLGVELKW